VDAQRALLDEHGLLDELGLPIFPLNTDGIDPAGTNVLIRNVSISNFDDAVAVKPCNGNFKYAKCSQNIVVEDSRVTWGLGMTVCAEPQLTRDCMCFLCLIGSDLPSVFPCAAQIGSVPPHENVNCVRDVIFRRINFTLPIKAVYVKTNPGTVGSGVISNITYEDIKAVGAVWWAIYIGPQQQKQPDGDGAGCMVRPLLRSAPRLVLMCPVPHSR
jgi:polygalacturonase